MSGNLQGNSAAEKTKASTALQTIITELTRIDDRITTNVFAQQDMLHTLLGIIQPPVDQEIVPPTQENAISIITDKIEQINRRLNALDCTTEEFRAL